MTSLFQILAILAIVGGTAFSAIGVLGYVRFPDAYTRLHATGKVGLFGVVLLVIAELFEGGFTELGLSKGIILIVLLLITGPVASHTIASVAYRVGIRMKDPHQNDLPAPEPPPRKKKRDRGTTENVASG